MARVEDETPVKQFCCLPRPRLPRVPVSSCMSALSHASSAGTHGFARRGRKMHQSKAKALPASTEALAVLEEESDLEELGAGTGPAATAASSVLREEALSTCFWSSPDVPSFDQTCNPVAATTDGLQATGELHSDSVSTSELTSLASIFDEKLSLAEIGSCASLCYSESEAGLSEDPEAGIESPTASEAPTLFSVPIALVEEPSGPQHFNIAGNDEEDAEEEYFPSIAIDLSTSESFCKPSSPVKQSQQLASPPFCATDLTLPPFPAAFVPSQQREAYVVTQPQPTAPYKKKTVPAHSLELKELKDPMCSPISPVTNFAASFGTSDMCGSAVIRPMDISIHGVKVC